MASTSIAPPTSSTSFEGNLTSSSSSPPSSSSAASTTISPHFSPLIHTFSTSELNQILERSRFHSFSHLLSGFEASIEKVTVRSTNYEPRLLSKFGVRFVERVLPPGFESTANNGATPATGYSSTFGGAGAGTTSLSTSTKPPATGSLTVPPPPPPPPTMPMPTTPFLWPTQAERDELFLDSLSSLITDRLQTQWISAREDDPLFIPRPTRPRRRIPTDEELAEDPTLVVVEKQVEEDNDNDAAAWDGKSLEQLTPWYTTMRDQVFKRREMSETEAFNTPIACLLALSSSHPDPLNALSALWDLTSKENLFSARAYPPRSGVEEDSRQEWANPDVLRYIVIVHDHGAGGGRDAFEDAKDLHEQIRKTYGHHTALLPINTAAPTAMKTEPRARGIASLWDESVPLLPGHGAPAFSRAAAIVGLGVDTEDANGGYTITDPATPITSSGQQSITSNPLEIGHELSDVDLKSIRVFLREMVVQSIVPWTERSVVVGYEQYQASKKSIGGRLFSAGRKYFGGATNGTLGKPLTNAAGQAIGYNTAKGFYPFVSQESQSRRLADLLFILHDYRLASTVYESLLKEYRNDRATRHFASSCRMMGLSLLLSHPSSQPLTFNPDQYLEMAGTSSSSSSSSTGVDLDALKAMMFYYEIYQVIPDFRPAPVGLVRTAGEVEEITSALLLEQAALADLRLPHRSPELASISGRVGGGGGGKKRKFGFHMIMAAKRYEQCGVKVLSRRCMNMTNGIYRGLGEQDDHLSTTLSSSGSLSSQEWWRDDVRYEVFYRNGSMDHSSRSIGGWKSITNHLHHTLARQAYTIGKSTEAVSHFLHLIQNQNENQYHDGVDDGEGGEDWLDDFALSWERLSEEDKRQGNWKLPTRIWNVVGVWTGREIDSNSMDDEAVWDSLRKDLGLVVEGDKSSKTYEAGVGELFHLELLATNPLNAPLAIGGLSVEVDTTCSIEIEAPQEIELAPHESRSIYVPLRSHDLGTINLTHIRYRFNDLLTCVEELQGRKKRLNTTAEHQKGYFYTDDRSMLSIEIKPPAPSLSINLESLPHSMYAGEIRATSVRVTNIGHVALVGLRVICSEPSFTRFVSLVDADEVYPSLSASTTSKTVETIVENRLPPNQPTVIPLGSTQALDAGQSIHVPLVLRGDASGLYSLRWVFSYQGDDTPQVLTSRATHQLHVQPSIEIRPMVQPSTSSSSEHYLLSWEIHNAHIPADLVITQIASLSPSWKVSMLPNVQFDEQFSPIGRQQSMSVVLAVQPTNHPTNDNDGDGDEDGHTFAVKQLDQLLQGRDVTKSLPGNVTLRHLSIVSSNESSTIDTTSSVLLPFLLRTHAVLRHSSLSTQFPTIDRTLHPHLFPLFNPRSLDLVLFWSCPTLGLQGHHHLADIPFGAGTNVLKTILETAELKAGGLYAESQRERSSLLAALKRSELGHQDNPLVVDLQVRENVEHDFEKGPCILPIEINIRNLSPHRPFNYTAILATSEAPTTTSFVYSGSLTYRGIVEPLGKSTIDTRGWIVRSGVYDLGGWNVIASLGEGEVSWTFVGSKKEVRINDVGGNELLSKKSR